MNIKKWLLIWTLTSLFIWFSNTFAAWLDHFQVTIDPSSAKAWEALDLIIEAVDKNNITVTDYEWVVLIFSESDPEAELPIALEDNTYSFVSSDLWKVVFEDALKFNSEWLQNINVYDFNDESVFGIGEVEIVKSEEVEKAEIDIISPENWLTIWDDKIKVSGSTLKNHQVVLVLNWETEFRTTSNNSWVYEKEVDWLVNGENLIVAKILNSDNEVIWESEEVSIEVDNWELVFKNLKITPEVVDSEWSFEVELSATSWLTDVSVIINDVITKVEETEDWLYLWKLYAPKEAWSYSIDIVLKDEMWHETKELWVSSIKVNEVEMESAEEPKEEEKVEEEKEVVVTKEEAEKMDLTIKWLKLIELKNRSILVWNEIEWVNNYNIYKKLDDWELELVDSTSESKYEIMMTWEEVKFEYFAVKAEAKDENWEVYMWDLSEATKIQTWPELVILLILSLILWFVYLNIKNRNA